MNREEIMKILPHRDNMLLLDEARVIEGKSQGKYLMRGDEWFFKGHFPGNPVTPGVVLCEILAQSACALLSDKMESDFTPYLVGLNNIKFKNSVRPGDLFETECEIIKTKGVFYFASGKGSVNGKECISGDFSFAVIRG